jgi:ribonucleotide monophosphatase NagD (HAD superfamily)
MGSLTTQSKPVFCCCWQRGVSFGLLFDIDGVIVRGKEVLSSAPKAFQKLVDKHGKFRIPTVFVTNSGNSLRHQKAKQLSEWLGIEVREISCSLIAHSNNETLAFCLI